ncbi:C-C chemokine receptor type 4-like [Ambystoma mexicanum]|uniref:C-C chemokine receptor type 4-like n=1 Tax=Ambystoma mexicanum TaxID=8296 RepID=UPI0037E991F3
METIAPSDNEPFTGSSPVYDDYDSTDVPPIFLCEKEEFMRFGSVFVPASYSLVFILSMTGNTLILIVLAKCEKLASVTNIFILNLVLSDLLFSVSLPFWAVYHSSQWIFGNIMCKIISWLFFLGFYSSVMFLTLMTVDRYLAIVHSLSTTSARRVRYATVASLAVWFISLVVSAPELIFSGERRNSNGEALCEEITFVGESYHTWKKVAFFQHSVMFYLVPLVIVIFCYSRILITITKSTLHKKCRVVKLVFFIVLLFFLCWTPYYLIIFVLFWQNVFSYSTCDTTVDYAYYICRSVAYFHCCVNPLFYTFLGTKYRKHFSYLIKLYCLPTKALKQQAVSIRLSALSNQFPNTLSSD